MHIVSELQIGFGSVRFLTGRRFQLHQHHRQTVDKQDNVGALLTVLNERPLISDDERIIIHVLVINEIDNHRAFFALFRVADRDSVLQIVHKYGVFLHKFAVLKVPQLEKSVLDSVKGRSLVDTAQTFLQHLIIQRAAEITLDIRRIDIIVIQIVLKQVYDSVFIIGFGIKGSHSASPLSY